MTLTPQKLVERLRARGGRYIALHLRYEKDMLSFTGCSYGLTDEESEELRIMRENTNHWKVKKINSTEQRLGGFCPLTPKEIGIFLRALGYPPSSLIYIAAGKIYGDNTHLLELTSRFPNIVFKETLATHEELRAFSGHASQTAALDYVISVESDVFVPSYSGNMARAVEGQRRFLGHRKTITPDRKGLVEVFDMLENGQQIEGSSLSHLIQTMHKNRKGAPRKRRGPLPEIKGRARLRTEESEGKVMMEYIGASGVSVSFDDVPINDEIDFHFILGFAIDADASGNFQNGIFSPYWISGLTPESVAAIKKRHPNVKVMASLSGWSVGAKVLHWYIPENSEKWITNAVSSLSSIITTYHLDGIDIDYEKFHNSSSTDANFAYCIGELITRLKNQGVISVASIAPFYSTVAPYIALFQGYGHAIDYVNHQFYTDKVETPKGYLAAFELRATQFDKTKLLPAYEVNGSGIQGMLSLML